MSLKGKFHNLHFFKFCLPCNWLNHKCVDTQINVYCAITFCNCIAWYWNFSPLILVAHMKLTANNELKYDQN